MTQALHTALGALGEHRADGLTITPTSTRALTQALQILGSQKAALHRDARLCLTELNHLGRVEQRAGTAEVGGGMRLGPLDAALAEHGLTLGPLSPRALALTLAEFLEGPDAGLRAIPGGRLEPLCLALTVVLPDGRVHQSHPSPRSATGPDLAALVLGAAGRIAVVTEAVVRCFPLPAARKSQTFSFPSADAFVAATLAALADGVWFSLARVETRAERAQVEFQCQGTVDSVERDFNSVGRRAFEVGGRPSGRLSGEFPIQAPQAASPEEREATWASVGVAVAAQRPLELHRLCLASVIVRGEVEGLSLEARAHWPATAAALAAALDPNGILGGVP